MKQRSRKNRLLAKRLSGAQIGREYPTGSRSLARSQYAKRKSMLSHGPRKSGVDALSRLRDALREQGLRELESDDPPASDLAQHAPWWAIVSMGFPGLPVRQSRSEMLMGLAPQGPRPDWEAIQSRWREIFESKLSANSRPTRLAIAGSFEPGPVVSDGGLVFHQGRALLATPLYSPDPREGRSTRSLLALFDKRRIKRRRQRSAPAAWHRLGACAEQLWRAGASLARLPYARDDKWLLAVNSLARAMLELGAARVERCPGFFARHPEALESEAGLASVEAAVSDSIRAAWAISAACAQAAIPASARRL